MSLEHKNIIVNNIRTHYATSGSGEPLVLLHGWFGSWKDWRKLLSCLSKYYQVIVLDFPGFNNSEKLSVSSIENYVEFLEEFFSKMDLSSFYLAGCSMGGILSFEYATRFPQKIKKLILIGTPVYFKEWLKVGQKFLGPLIKNKTFTKRIIASKLLLSILGIHPKNMQIIRQNILSADLIVASDILKDLVNHDLRKHTKQLNIPTMIFVGRGDILASAKDMVGLMNLIPKSKLTVINVKTHFQLFDHPKNLLKKFFEFLDHRQ